MKIALAQIDSVIGDFDGNIRIMADYYQRACKMGADLVVFPEMAVCGYPPRDLLERHSFALSCEEAITAWATSVKKAAVIVGAIFPNRKSVGKPLHNSAVFIADGQIKAIRHKTLLPAYDVFDEGRYFEPGTDHEPVLWQGKKIGLTICEDIWGPHCFGGRHLYGEDPIPIIAQKKPDILVNISASPYSVRKHRMRINLLKTAADRCGAVAVMCNQVGGNDELVFDGQSMAVDAGGNILALCLAFEEDLIIFDTEAKVLPKHEREFEKEEEMLSALILGLRDYAKKCGFKKAIVGISGGIDSAVVADIAVRALGKKAVCGVSMPSKYTSKLSIDLADKLAKSLAIELRTVPIDDIYESYLKELGAAKKITVADENIQARIRGNILMYISNKEGALVLSTGNKSELAMGYCTLYGDMAGGLALISDVWKTNIFKIARFMNRERLEIPEEIIKREPSAELSPGQKDSDSLPPYDVLDAILEAFIEERMSEEQIVAKGYKKELVRSVLKQLDRNEYKRRQAAPGIKVSAKAFGTGRRLPIAWKG